ncbi:MAG: bifunctional heptose 7-phosphate kinase/heptose 1-phosphate adenyltransferase [Candidatus Acidiferrales bacterium]
MATPSPARLRALIRRFRGKRLAVVGDLMLDRFIRGRVARISPEAPVPVVEVNQPETQHLGGAGNVAANLAALGARPAVFGVVGRDEAARTLRRELASNRIAAGGVVADPQRPTTVKTRIIAEHQHVVRADQEQAAPLPRALERRLLAAFRRAAPRLDGVILSDYDKGVLTEALTAELLALCQAQRLPVFVDLKAPKRLDPGVTLVLVNQRRAEEIAGREIDSEKTLQLVGRHLMARFPCSTLVVTRGAQGMVVFEKGRRRTSALRVAAVRTRPWEVFDVTGAGDTVMAALALATVAGATPGQAAALANAAAGIVVGKLGTAVATPAELLESLAGKRRA